MANDEALAVSGLLSLSGQLLQHNADIQNIETGALLERDRLAFDTARESKREEHDYNVRVFDLLNADINDMERESDILDQEYIARTGVMPEEETTAGFKEFHEG